MYEGISFLDHKLFVIWTRRNKMKQENICNDNIPFGQRILSERWKWRINQSELCEKMGIGKGTLVDIEHLKIGIDDPTFKRFMQVINEIIEEKRQYKFKEISDEEGI